MIIRSYSDLVQAIDADTESEHLEFKEAKTRYDFDELTKYCCALANEGGGSIILGVSDKKPRKIVGTSAFKPPDRQKTGLFQRLRWRVDVFEIDAPEGRVLAFNVPGRPSGLPLHYDGRYWMRVGSDLLPMSPEFLNSILRESTPDFSSEIVDTVILEDIDINLVEKFAQRWSRKQNSPDILNWRSNEILENAELTIDGKFTYAAIILLGTQKSVSRHLSQCETVFEYRSADANIQFQQRKEFKSGFLGWYDELWSLINLRNDIQQFNNGLLRFDIPMFAEETIREAILNAVCHREYRDAGSIWIKQFPKHIEINSPGGFPQGVSAENILKRQKPRNRRLAEALARCGFVERSGQGADLMFRQSIQQSKPLPDYSGTDHYSVNLNLRGEVQDRKFVEFLEKIGQEKTSLFTIDDFLVFDAIHKGTDVPPALTYRTQFLQEIGVIESIGKKRHVLSRSFYSHLGRAGDYTRRKGLDYDTEKELLYKHINMSRAGAPIGELLQVLPSRSRAHVKQLLNDLRTEGRVHSQGVTRAGKWFSGPDRAFGLDSKGGQSQ